MLDGTVHLTDHHGHAVTLAEQAIDAGATTLVAVGGDGTVNEVLQGIVAADGFEQVDFGVIPAGTGNSFAKNIGIPDIETGFDVLQHGERRRIDVGMANHAPFLNSCIAGLTAEASGRTDSGLKARIGVAAYVLSTIRTWSAYDGLTLRVEVDPRASSHPAWSGPVGLVVVGNARRFSMTGGEQANVEDGLFDVAILEDPGSIELSTDSPLDRLGELLPELIRLHAPTLAITVEHDETAQFSLDGEMQTYASVTLEVRPRVLRVAVGESYEPDGIE